MGEKVYVSVHIYLFSLFSAATALKKLPLDAKNYPYNSNFIYDKMCMHIFWKTPNVSCIIMYNIVI